MTNPQQRSVLSIGRVLYGPSHFLHPNSKLGRKRRFVLAGMTNIVLTNTILQLLLLTPVFTVWLATLLSQSFNGIFGFAIYGKIVFNTKPPYLCFSWLRYSMLMGLTWLCNWAGIELLKIANFPANTAGLIMIAPLAGISYIIQKTWIFKNP